MSKTSLIAYGRSTPICRLIRTIHSRNGSRLGAEWLPRNRLEHPSWVVMTWAFGHPRVLGRLRRASKGDPILRLYTPLCLDPFFALAGGFLVAFAAFSNCSNLASRMARSA